MIFYVFENRGRGGSCWIACPRQIFVCKGLGLKTRKLAEFAEMRRDERRDCMASISINDYKLHRTEGDILYSFGLFLRKRRIRNGCKSVGLQTA